MLLYDYLCGIVSPMSPETAGVEAGKQAIEARDPQGNELFPADDIARILQLPDLLAEELEDAPHQAQVLRRDIDNLTYNLGTAYEAAGDVSRGDRDDLRFQAITRNEAINDLQHKNGRFPNAYARLKEGAYNLGPEEVSYFTALVLAGKEPTGEDFIHAGTLDQPSRVSRVLGRGPRLFEDTPENIEQFKEIGEALQLLLMLENQERATRVLHMCLGYGDRKQVRTAVNLFNRFSRIACDEELGMDEKVAKQLQANADTVRLARSLSFSQKTDETTLERIHARIDHFEEIYKNNWVMDRTLAMTLYGKEFRANGNRHPVVETEPEPVEAESILPPVEPVPVPETPEPEPDFVAHYTAKVQELVGSIGFEKFSVLPAKEIKRRGLDTAREILVKGEADEDGVQIVGGRSKQDSHLYISSIEFIHSFIPGSESLEEAREALEKAVQESASFKQRLGSVLSEARSSLKHRQLSEIMNSAPDIKAVGEVVELVRDDWETASFVIGKYWPDGHGKVKQLRELLFPNAEERANVQPVELSAGEEAPIREQAA